VEMNSRIVEALVQFVRENGAANLLALHPLVTRLLDYERNIGPTLDLLELIWSAQGRPSYSDAGAPILMFLARESFHSDRAQKLLFELDPRFSAKDDDACAQMSKTELIETATCPICRDLIKAPTLALPCLHSFCATCLQGWLARAPKRDCPLCRTVVQTRAISMRTMKVLTRLKTDFGIVEMPDDY